MQWHKGCPHVQVASATLKFVMSFGWCTHNWQQTPSKHCCKAAVCTSRGTDPSSVTKHLFYTHFYTRPNVMHHISRVKLILHPFPSAPTTTSSPCSSTSASARIVWAPTGDHTLGKHKDRVPLPLPLKPNHQKTSRRIANRQTWQSRGIRYGTGNTGLALSRG